MKFKIKIILIVFMTLVILQVSTVGVWSIKFFEFVLGGTINYKIGIEAQICNASFYGLSLIGNDILQENKCKNISIDPYMLENELNEKYNSWKNISIDLNEIEPVLAFDIFNTKTFLSIYPFLSIEISLDYENINNAEVEISNTNGGNKIYLAPGDNVEYIIRFYVKDALEEASVENLNINFSLEMMKTSPKESEVQLLYDSVENFYYVEMGNLGDKKIKWKLASFDGKNKFIVVKPNPPIMYQSIEGDDAYNNAVFIQETIVEGFHYFYMSNTDLNANDYSSSVIRDYIMSGTFAESINIYESNNIYQRIQTRDIKSLMTDIGWAYSEDDEKVPNNVPNGVGANEIYSLTPSNIYGLDKLWLLSMKELYIFVGGGRIKNNKIPYVWPSVYQSNVIWKNSDSANAVNYWLRSPDPKYSYYGIYVGSDGYCHDVLVDDTAAIIRAGFYINF